MQDWPTLRGPSLSACEHAGEGMSVAMRALNVAVIMSVADYAKSDLLPARL